MLAVTASYSAKFLKPCFLMTDLSSASYLALALFDNTVPCITCSTAADMSFWAAINPSTCLITRPHPPRARSGLGKTMAAEGSLFGWKLNNAGVATEQHSAVRGQTAAKTRRQPSPLVILP